MDITKKTQDALTKQITNEFHAAYLYLSMSAYFEDLELKGFASWMRSQANEELGHGMKIFDFINDRNGRVFLEKIGPPKSNFKSPLEVMQTALGHERRVTELIHQLYEQAKKEKDAPTESFLKWFIDEQVEEEDQANYLVEQLKLIGNSKSGLFLLDRELAKRKD